MQLKSLTFIAACLLALGACDSDSNNNNTDTGTADTGTADTGTADTGTADTGTADTGTADTGTADTGTADTGTADTGVPPIDIATKCPGILLCASECTDQACQQACFGMASPAAELQNLQAMSNCYQDEGCIVGEPQTLDQDCVRAKCIAEVSTCYAGTEFTGDLSCGAMNGCVNACTLATTEECLRSCMSQGTAETAEDFQDMQLCFAIECASVSAASQQQCVQDSTATGQPCAGAYNTCLGNIGAAPGAGSGGGIPSGDFKFVPMDAFQR